MNSILLKQLLLQTRQKSSQSRRSERGFTMIEVMLVVSIIAIFAAIAVPAWNGFITRQRIRTVNNLVLRELQNVQAEAKRNKVARKIEFGNDNNNMPVYRIYQPDSDGDFNPTGDLIDETVINIDGQIKPGKIQITTQANRGGARLQDAIIFDHIGSVIDPEKMPDPKQNTDGFTVTVSTPNGGFKQCVKVVTLLGAMITSEGDDNQTGCP